MIDLVQIGCVQQDNASCPEQSVCQSNLETQRQQPLGLLNTCLHTSRVWGCPLWIVPTLANRRRGDFPVSLSREPVTRHRLAETYDGPPGCKQGVLRLGYARNSQLTGQQETENVSPLNAGLGTNAGDMVSLRIVGLRPPSRRNASKAGKPQGHVVRDRHSVGCSFPFLSHFRGDNSHMRRLAIPQLFLGGILLFSALSFPFIHSFSRHNKPLETKNQRTKTMHISALRQSKFLTRHDVGAGILVTIKGLFQTNVAMEGAPEELRWAIEFGETEKPLICNSTNAQIIAQIAKSEETDHWVGVKIVLYDDPNVSFGGKLVGGIRVRAPRGKATAQQNAPAPTKPAPVAAPTEDQDDIPF